jgi:hypothetical protein
VLRSRVKSGSIGGSRKMRKLKRRGRERNLSVYIV